MKNTKHTSTAQNKDEYVLLDKYVVRAHLAMRRTNLNRWAIDHGFNRHTAALAVKGFRRGPTPRRIVNTLRRELGL